VEELIQQMVARIGIDRATAAKVIEFLKEHVAEVEEAIGARGALDKLPGLDDPLKRIF
jgi:hypothetical protein